MEEGTTGRVRVTVDMRNRENARLAQKENMIWKRELQEGFALRWTWGIGKPLGPCRKKYDFKGGSTGEFPVTVALWNWENARPALKQIMLLKRELPDGFALLCSCALE